MIDTSGSGGQEVPQTAYVAADGAFDGRIDEAEGDELYAALCAASPYIRLDEIGRHLMVIRRMTGAAEILHYLEEQQALLVLFTR